MELHTAHTNKGGFVHVKSFYLRDVCQIGYVKDVLAPILILKVHFKRCQLDEVLGERWKRLYSPFLPRRGRLDRVSLFDREAEAGCRRKVMMVHAQ